MDNASSRMPKDASDASGGACAAGHPIIHYLLIVSAIFGT